MQQAPLSVGSGFGNPPIQTIQTKFKKECLAVRLMEVWKVSVLQNVVYRNTCKICNESYVGKLDEWIEHDL